MNMQLGFARWRSPVASGGNRYDDALLRALGDHGLEVRAHVLDGPWPIPADQHRAALSSVLRRESAWLIDNILASAAPHEIAAAVSSGRSVAVLVHFFPGDDRALSRTDRAQLARSEAAAIRAATTVITTSRWTAAEVARRYGRHDAVVAVPGVDPAPLAPGSGGHPGPRPDSVRSCTQTSAVSPSTGPVPHLLWLARITETKDPETLLRALAQLGDLRWTARLVGPHALDPALTHRLRQQAAEAGLTSRIHLTGSQEGADLDAIWNTTDLLVHTAREEPYGMVVSEALARGIPSIVPCGTGAVEAQHGAGAQFPAGEARDLAALLRSWLSDTHIQEQWRRVAHSQRESLPTWSDVAAVVAESMAAAR